MDRDTARARIQQGLGFRADMVDEIIAAMQEAQRLLETGRSLPSFLLQEEQTLAVTAGTANISLPTGFIREWQEQPLNFVDPNDADTIVFLEKLDFQRGTARFPSTTDPSAPQAYALLKNSIKFWPQRDIAYTLRWGYYKHSVSLATNVSNNEWLDETSGAPEALIGRAGMIIAADLGDKESLQKFSSMYSTSWNGITTEDQLDDEENRPLAVGSRL